MNQDDERTRITKLFTPELPFFQARKLELLLFKMYNSTCNNGYRKHVRTLLFNIKNKTNPNLRQKIKEKEITLEQLIEMNSYELFPENWTKQMKRREYFDKKLKEEYEPQKDEIESEFICYKCKSRSIEYSQLQTRSADEPLTTYFHCKKCGNRWKI